MPVATPPPEDAPEEELQDDDQTANFGTPPHVQDIFPPSDGLASTALAPSDGLASTALGKGKNKAIDTAAAEFVAACSKTKLDDGSKKPVDSLAAKLNEKCLIRLIAGAHLLASQ